MFENDQPKYESAELRQLIQKQVSQPFIVNVDGLERYDKSIDAKSIQNVMLRNWKSIQDAFENLKLRRQLWMLMDFMRMREKQSIYEINKNIASNQESPYQDQKCNITDSNHCFLLREFQDILLRLSS